MRKKLRKYEAYLNSLPDTHEISNEESFKAWVKILSSNSKRFCVVEELPGFSLIKHILIFLRIFLTAYF
jgi:hypothetical protein